MRNFEKQAKIKFTKISVDKNKRYDKLEIYTVA
jgi:hypothetical protein